MISGKIKRWVTSGFLLMAIISLGAQTFSTIHDFANSDGAVPIGSLILVSNTLYGVTLTGGSQGNGTIFSVNTDGSNFRVLHNFTATDPVAGTNQDGATPDAGLVLCGITLFGTTSEGGTNPSGYHVGCGTIFSIDTDGSNFNVVHQFNGSDGRAANAPLLQYGSLLYGSTYLGGGGGDDGESPGTLFSINTNGNSYTVIHNFQGYPEGGHPQGDLVVISNEVYGATEQAGTVYSFASGDVLSEILHEFVGNSDGQMPQGGVLNHGNQLFGVTLYGGSVGNGTIYTMNTEGGDYVQLHIFTPTFGGGLYSSPNSGTNSDGAGPAGHLICCTNVLYGTTYWGGSQSNGVVFAMGTDGGNYVVLHSFTGTDPDTGANEDGANSESGLVLSNNTLYGTATSGGTQGFGTIFSIQLPSVTGIVCLPDGSVAINFAGGAATNLVQVSTNLSSPAFWQTISTNAADTNGLWQFTDSNANNYRYRFYRSVSQ